MVVVSFFTKKIPRSELGGLTWSTINEAPIAFGAIGEHHDHQKVENGTISGTEAMELIEKNGEIPPLFVCFLSLLRTTARLAQWDKRRSAEQEVAGSNPSRTNTQGL